MPYLPKLHTSAEDLEYFAKVVTEDTVWVAEADRVVGFVAFGKGWINHLYVEPGFQGQSIGSALLDLAITPRAIIRLWVFQQNKQAIRFYTAHGFRLIKETDGAENEEHVPDALYELQPADIEVRELEQ